MHHLHKTIQHLRHQEAILLFGKIVDISPADEVATAVFLSREYENESLNYPHQSPQFDSAAALWSAKFTYSIAQLMLDRKQAVDDFARIIPSYKGEQSAAAILSADLCLRFMPLILQQLQSIDSEDLLIPIVEKEMKTWHYSNIRITKKTTDLDMTVVLANPCLYQLYVNRVIEYKNKILSEQTDISPGVKASLGLYTELLF